MARRRATTALLLAALLGFGCEGGGARSAPAGPPPASVEVVTVTPGPLDDVAEFTGALEAAESVLVRPEVSGIVATVEFREGERVKRGDLLFRLRGAEERARLAEARAALELAEREYERARTLKAGRVLSTEEIDRAEAELARARARLEVARVALERKEIRAPFDGVLGARLVSPGARVSGVGRIGPGEGTGMVQIDAVDELKLVFSVPEVAIPAIRKGAPVEIEVAPYPGERFHGRITFVAPSLDPRSRRLLVKARVPNPDRRLRPGLSARVFLQIGRHEHALTVPSSAVVRDVAGAFVWRLLPDGTAERVPVEIGIRQPGRVEIVSGLAAGDRVVSVGTHKVAAGRPLEIAEPGGRPDEAAPEASGEAAAP